jgi:low affinity Fe/Cu permease
MTPAKSSSRFTRFAKGIAHATGQPVTFALAVFVVLAWSISGPLFHFSDTWQLVINTGTTIVTFLMVFLIQSTQNRDSEAVQIKLDELLRISPGAHNVLINLEELEERELERIKAVYAHLAAEARKGVSHGRSDSGVPAIGDLVEKQVHKHAAKRRGR